MQARARMVSILKVLFVVAGLAMIVQQAGARVPSGKLTISIWGAVGALTLNQLALLAAAARFRSVLAGFDIKVSLWRANVIHLQSMFYYFLVPMSVGLEIARYTKVRQVTSSARPASLVAALLCDRFAGMMGMLTIVAVLALPMLRPTAAPIPLITIILCVACCVAVLALVALIPRTRRRLAELFDALWTMRRGLISVLGLSCLTQLLVCASVVCLFAGSSLAVDPYVVTLGLSAAGVGFLVPASLLGISFADAAGVAILCLLALTPSIALLLTSAAFGGRLIAAIEGGLVEALQTASPWARRSR